MVQLTKNIQKKQSTSQKLAGNNQVPLMFDSTLLVVLELDTNTNYSLQCILTLILKSAISKSDCRILINGKQEYDILYTFSECITQYFNSKIIEFFPFILLKTEFRLSLIREIVIKLCKMSYYDTFICPVKIVPTKVDHVSMIIS